MIKVAEKCNYPFCDCHSEICPHTGKVVVVKEDFDLPDKWEPEGTPEQAEAWWEETLITETDKVMWEWISDKKRGADHRLNEKIKNIVVRYVAALSKSAPTPPTIFIDLSKQDWSDELEEEAHDYVEEMNFVDIRLKSTAFLAYLAAARKYTKK